MKPCRLSALLACALLGLPALAVAAAPDANRANTVRSNATLPKTAAAATRTDIATAIPASLTIDCLALDDGVSIARLDPAMPVDAIPAEPLEAGYAQTTAVPADAPTLIARQPEQGEAYAVALETMPAYGEGFEPVMPTVLCAQASLPSAPALKTVKSK